MTGDDGDDARRQKKRERDAAAARRRRADARARLEAESQATYDDVVASQNVVDDGKATGATGSQTTFGVSGTVAYLPVRPRTKSGVEKAIALVERYMDYVEADRSLGIGEKLRLFVMALKALITAYDAVELKERIERLEARLDARDRRGRF